VHFVATKIGYLNMSSCMFYEVIKDLTVYNLKISVDFLFNTVWSSNSTDEVLSRVWQNAV
jgi:uncharacterized protein YlaN (UPF0358 family)